MMKPEAVKIWLKQKKTGGFLLNLSVGLVGLLVGILVVFLTFWFTYAIIWFGWLGVSDVSDLLFNKRLHLTHHWRLLLSGVFVVLLFIQHFRTSRWYWGTYPEDDYVASSGLVAHSGVMGACAMLLAYPEASANLIADILLTGPRLVTGSVKMMAQGFRWQRLDVDNYAELLVFLHTRTELVTYEELNLSGWGDWLRQVRGLDGVQFLKNGLVLSRDWRDELNTLLINQTNGQVC